MARRTAILLVLFTVVIALVAVAQSATTVRVFNLKNASVVEAFMVIQPLLSSTGEVTVQPGRNRVTIQDDPQVVDKITTLMVELDRIPGEYRIEVELLEGLDVDRASDLPDELDRRLRRMFPFKGYRRTGQTVFQGEFGVPTRALLSSGYRLSFLAEESNVSESTPWGVADVANRTHVKWLRLDRITGGSGGDSDQVDELLRTAVFLSPKQKMIIGAGSSEDSGRGLVLILTMHSVEDR